MTPETTKTCSKYFCSNEAQFDSIFIEGGHLCINHAAVEVEDYLVNKS